MEQKNVVYDEKKGNWFNTKRAIKKTNHFKRNDFTLIWIDNNKTPILTYLIRWKNVFHLSKVPSRWLFLDWITLSSHVKIFLSRVTSILVVEENSLFSGVFNEK